MLCLQRSSPRRRIAVCAFYQQAKQGFHISSIALNRFGSSVGEMKSDRFGPEILFQLLDTFSEVRHFSSGSSTADPVRLFSL
jgi:hypothetical protein